MNRVWKDRFAAACGSALSKGKAYAAAALWVASALASLPLQADTGPSTTTAPTAATYTWDANGQLASKTQSGRVTRYSFNALHQLLGVALPDGTRVAYGYGPDGNIASRSKTTPQGAKSTTHYLVDPTARFPRIVAEYDDQGHLTATFLYGDELLARRKAGVETYFEHDGHGSVVTLTDVNGGATQTYSYDAWGNAVEAIGSDENEFRYTGELQDPDTGLIYLRARWYDPAVGRFASPDETSACESCIGTGQTYGYADGDPLNGRDPSGNQTLAEQNTAGQINANVAVQNGQAVVRSAFKNVGCELGVALAQEAVNYGIYILVDTVSGQLYVGKSVDIDSRFRNHIARAIREAENLWKVNAKILARFPISGGARALAKAEQLVKEILENAGQKLLNDVNPIARKTTLYKQEFQALKRVLCGKLL